MIPLWVLFLPVLGVVAHLVEGARGSPAEDVAGLIGASPELGQVKLVHHWDAVAALEGIHDFQHTVWRASAEVEDIHALMLGVNMRLQCLGIFLFVLVKLVFEKYLLF